jgi:hypothetical protein
MIEILLPYLWSRIAQIDALVVLFMLALFGLAGWALLTVLVRLVDLHLPGWGTTPLPTITLFGAGSLLLGVSAFFTVSGREGTGLVSIAVMTLFLAGSLWARRHRPAN